MIGNTYVQIGIMGSGISASEKDMEFAYDLGVLLAKEPNFALISGGMQTGVMDASLRGFTDGGGGPERSLAILSSRGERKSEHGGLVVPTGMGSGRNYFNAVSSDIIVAIGDLTDPGTLSEVALKIANVKDTNTPHVVLLGGVGRVIDALRLDYGPSHVVTAPGPELAVKRIKEILKDLQE